MNGRVAASRSQRAVSKDALRSLRPDRHGVGARTGAPVEVATRHDIGDDATFRAYLQAALDCVVVADGQGRVVEFNPAAEQTFGYRREEALGKPLSDLIVPPSLRERH